MDARLCLCKICSSGMQPSFEGTALKRHPFRMLHCLRCGFMQIEDPYWLEEAYSDVIAACDTGLVARNLSLATLLTPLFFYLFGVDGRYVDFAGGTGLFVRLMRDVGFDFYWRDPYCENIHSRGFEFENGLEYRAVTAFEVFEHVIEPIEFVSSVLEESGSDALFFSTELFSGTPPKADEWWYYAFDAGQHISFYQAKTLESIAERLNKKFFSYHGLHVFCNDLLFDRLRQYFNSWMIRRFALKKYSRFLTPRTMPDHLLLLGKGEMLK